MLLHCLAFSRPTLEIGCHLSSCGLCHTWVGWGTLFFPGLAISSRSVGSTLLLAASGAQGLYTGTSQCGSHPGGLVVFHWFRPSVDGPSWTQWGSMPVLVRDLAPCPRRGTARLCWLGPCPHDPLRCGLNSSPSHRCHVQLAAVRQIPQGRSTVLRCYCIVWLSHVLPWKLCATSLPGAAPRMGGYITVYFPRSASRSLRCSGPTLEPHSMAAPRGARVSPPAQANQRRSLMDAVGQHVGAG